MSHKRILSIAPGKEELWAKARNQGYVWIKTRSGFVTKDYLKLNYELSTVWYNIWISQKDYGKIWAFTKGEL